MKSKRFIQILVIMMLTIASVGGGQPALASSSSAPLMDAMIVNRNLNFWDATYIGYVSSTIFEKWHFDFTETHNFVITVSPVTNTGEFVPLLTLEDANGAVLGTGANTLTSTQGAGSYSIQVQPESTGGFYILTLRELVQTQPSSTTVVSPTSVNVGESATVTVNLNNVPAEGYTSAEFTCTYSATLIEVSNVNATLLFGADPATALNGPLGGSFIFAIAGSNGNKATTSGPAFTFSVKGLLPGQTTIDCTARVSKGDNILIDLPSSGATLTVLGTAPTATFTPTPFATATSTSSVPEGSATPTSSTPVGSPTATSETPVESATATSSTPVESPTATATSIPVETATPTFTSTPIASPTFTSTPIPNGTVTGTVLAGKPVTVSLYDANNTLITSATVNQDGSFSLSAPAGTYTIRATASGFLAAEGSATLGAGGSTSMPTITLLAGDIDGNDVIDQFDALTIGMSYNTDVPAAADLNNDGIINVLDLELLAQNYRATGPTTWAVSYP